MQTFLWSEGSSFLIKWLNNWLISAKKTSYQCKELVEDHPTILTQLFRANEGGHGLWQSIDEPLGGFMADGILILANGHHKWGQHGCQHFQGESHCPWKPPAVCWCKGYESQWLLMAASTSATSSKLSSQAFGWQTAKLVMRVWLWGRLAGGGWYSLAWSVLMGWIGNIAKLLPWLQGRMFRQQPRLSVGDSWVLKDCAFTLKCV